MTFGSFLSSCRPTVTVELFFALLAVFSILLVMALSGSIDFFDSIGEKYLDESNFFPKGHNVVVRPTDKQALYGRVIENASLYKIFHDFIFDNAVDKDFIDTELDFILKMGANIVVEINGTTGSGKSQLSRLLAKTLARKRHCNIRFIIDGNLYESSGGKKGYIKIILDKSFKDTLNCYVTYSFFETSNMVRRLNKKDMIIQDEIEKSMGTDSTLIRNMINNIININIRKNQISMIFNTPLFVPIKNLNFIVETFGIKNNHDNDLRKENMITYAILYDKNCKPFSITTFPVWESNVEHDFYEKNSQIRKDEFKTTGGGKTVTPDRKIVDKAAEILFDEAMKERPSKKETLKSIARYLPELGGLPSGMLTDIVVFAWDKYSQLVQEETAEKKKKRKEAEADTDQDFMSEMAWDKPEISDDEFEDGTTRDPVPERQVDGSLIKEAASSDELLAGNLEPLLNFVSNCVFRDFGKYYQNLWDWIVGVGMTYDAVSDKLKKLVGENVDPKGAGLSHMSIGNHFKKVREGSKKEGKATGVGYYTELWWAKKHNKGNYKYISPGNESSPDYIHEDGTVDSVKAYYEVRNTYFVPSQDCKPEVRWCEEHGLPSFRLVFINYKQTTEKFLIKIVDVKEKDKKITFKPGMFS